MTIRGSFWSVRSNIFYYTFFMNINLKPGNMQCLLGSHSVLNDTHLLPSYDNRSSDRRPYDRHYGESYRRLDYSRDRDREHGTPRNYYSRDASPSYDYRGGHDREREDSYRRKGSRRKHKRRRRRTRSYSPSSSVSTSIPEPALSLPQILSPISTSTHSCLSFSIMLFFSTAPGLGKYELLCFMFFFLLTFCLF